jgi:MFS family permease
MIAGLGISALGWTLYPLVRESWQAIALATLTGGGIGVWLTMQSTALALIVPQNLRHAAFAQQRVAANLGLGFGGFAGGLLVTTASPRSFTALFLLNATTFLAYAVFVGRLHLPRPAGMQLHGAGYRTVIRDRIFRRLLVLNFLFVIAAIALLNGLFPVFAKNQAGVSEDAIGLFFLLNSLVIIVAQLPTARALEGHRRARGLALMCVLFGCCWVLVELAGLARSYEAAILLIVVGIAVLSVGECLYDSIVGPLVADLAPEGRTGRYMAVSGLSWTLGFTAAPALGGALLGAEPFVLWPVAAGLALLAGVSALRFESSLPPGLRVTPRRS